MPNQLTRLVYIMWLSIYGKPSQLEIGSNGSNLCHAIRDHCQNIEYLNLRPYSVCCDLWTGSNFEALAACSVVPMIYRDCNPKFESRDMCSFSAAYQQARAEGRLPALAEEKAMISRCELG
jgi:hypothetical protein